MPHLLHRCGHTYSISVACVGNVQTHCISLMLCSSMIKLPPLHSHMPHHATAFTLMPHRSISCHHSFSRHIIQSHTSQQLHGETQLIQAHPNRKHTRTHVAAPGNACTTMFNNVPGPRKRNNACPGNRSIRHQLFEKISGLTLVFCLAKG